LEVEHNDRARLLRNGLAIAAFASLESFLKGRTVEALKQVSGAKLKFVELPERLQRLATVDSIAGTKFHLSRVDDIGEVRTLSQDLGDHLHSLGANTFELGFKMMASSSSNVSKGSVPDMLGAVGLKGGWSAMHQLSIRTLVGLDPAVSFQSLSASRHEAAHDPSSVGVSAPDIADMYLKALSIAIPFDALVSEGCRRLADRQLLNQGDGWEQDEVHVWTLSSANGTWELKEPTGTLVPLVASSPDDALLEASALARQTKGLVLQVDASNVPVDWAATAVD
jgi:hypothetical protein